MTTQTKYQRPVTKTRPDLRFVPAWIEPRGIADDLRSSIVIGRATKLALGLIMTFEQATGFSPTDHEAIALLTDIQSNAEARERGLRRRVRSINSTGPLAAMVAPKGASRAAFETVVAGQAIHAVAEMIFDTFERVDNGAPLEAVEAMLKNAATEIYRAVFSGPDAALALSSMGNLLDDGDIEPLDVTGDDEPDADAEDDDPAGDGDVDAEDDDPSGEAAAL